MDPSVMSNDALSDAENPEDFDRMAYKRLGEILEKLMASGATEEDAVAAAGDAYTGAIKEMASNLADVLVSTAPAMLEWHRNARDTFEQCLRIHWGEALDRYFTIVVCAEEVVGTFDRAERPRAARDQDLVFEALTRLHGRACRVALEVHHLLSGGFALGALARCRTLHELAVTATILADYGRRPEHHDLANRYLLHAAVISYNDAKVYQERCEVLGGEPFSDADMEQMQRRYDELRARYGKKYTKDNGWAAELLSENPTFENLEKLAQLSHLRAHYKWGCHEVHSDAKGLSLNDYEQGGVTYRSTGVVNTGLAEPGHLALISLHQCTVALLLGGSEGALPSTSSLGTLMALQQLVDEAGKAFGDGQVSVDRAEAQLAEPTLDPASEP